MGHYKITVSHTVENEVEETTVDYQVIMFGYCGNDGGQSDIEGETEYYIDDEQVEDFDALPDEIKTLFCDMELNDYAKGDYTVKHETPQPYSEWD